MLTLRPQLSRFFTGNSRQEPREFFRLERNVNRTRSLVRSRSETSQLTTDRLPSTRYRGRNTEDCQIHNEARPVRAVRFWIATELDRMLAGRRPRPTSRPRIPFVALQSNDNLIPRTPPTSTATVLKRTAAGSQFIGRPEYLTILSTYSVLLYATRGRRWNYAHLPTMAPFL